MSATDENQRPHRPAVVGDSVKIVFEGQVVGLSADGQWVTVRLDELGQQEVTYRSTDVWIQHPAPPPWIPER